MTYAVVKCCPCPRVPGTPRGLRRGRAGTLGLSYVPAGGEVVLGYGSVSSVIIWAGKFERGCRRESRVVDRLNSMTLAEFATFLNCIV